MNAKGGIAIYRPGFVPYDKTYDSSLQCKFVANLIANFQVVFGCFESGSYRFQSLLGCLKARGRPEYQLLVGYSSHFRSRK